MALAINRTHHMDNQFIMWSMVQPKRRPMVEGRSQPGHRPDRNNFG